MIKFLLELHRLSYGSNEHYKYKETNKIKWIICVVVYISTRCLFFYYMKLREMFRINPSFKGIVNDEIVVSLTSFPARINNVWMVID